MSIHTDFRRAAVAAALAAAGLLSGGLAHATATGSIAVTSVQIDLFDLNPNDNVAASISFGGGLTEAQVEALTFGPFSFSGNWDTGYLSQVLGFTLGAYTGVQFKVGVSLLANTTGAGEYAISGLGLGTGNFRDPNPNNWTFTSGDLKSVSSTNGVGDAPFNSYLTVGYGNWTGTSFTQDVGLAGISQGITPVPEPGAYAMFLAGLVAVGATARRRRAQ